MTDLSRFAQSQIDPTSRLREIFPDFVASDYPIFIAFLDAYYTWLQQSTQPVGALRTIQQSQTTEIETFANQFLAQYLPNLPSTSTLDLKQLLYWVRGLYQLRGTPLGFELFWKVLYGMTVDVLTPYDYTLKSSDGLWSTQQSLKIRPILNDATFAGRLVIGETSGATVGIETTQQTNLNGISYTVSPIPISERFKSMNGSVLMTPCRPYGLKSMGWFRNLIFWSPEPIIQSGIQFSSVKAPDNQKV